jgi:hypothetical protein
MKKNDAVKLKKGDKVFVRATHYTGKIKLNEPPYICVNGYFWLSGVGSEGQLVGCAPRFACFRKQVSF